MPGDDREQRIRELARALWEQDGRPEGQAERHWRIANQVVEFMERAPVEVAMEPSRASTHARPLQGIA